jgi:hypothetical protein
VPSLDDQIDRLFAGPLAGFTAARNTLAKSLKGDDAARVKALTKPAIVAWAVNQVYWHARPIFDRLIESGRRLRKAQVAALEGKAADVRGATAAHRDALAAAAKEAERLAAAHGSHPPPDAVTRTLEALSLAPDAHAPGRLTEPLQPAGFEALAGLSPAGSRGAAHAAHTGGGTAAHAKPESPARARAAAAAEARRAAEEEKEQEAEARRREADIRKAEAALARAQAAERRAHEAWLDAQREVDEARQALTRSRSRTP